MASITKSSTNGWAYRATIGSGEARHQVYKSGFSTKREATIAAAEAEASLDYKEDSKTATLPDYYDRWTQAFKIGRASAITDEWYRVVGGYIHEWFDKEHPGLLIADVDRTTYQAFLDWCGSNPRGKRQRPLSHSTVARINSYMRAVLKDAIEDGYTKKDFTRRAIVGGTAEKDESKKYVDLREFKKMIQLATKYADLSHMSNFITVFMALTGARFEEALGVTWDNLDLAAGTVTFTHSWQYKTRKQHDNFGPLKNKQSYRTIPISSNLVEILKKLRLEQQTAFMADGWRDEDNLVFRNASHRIIGNEAMSKTVKGLCEAAGAKNTITSHGLRHSHGSMLMYEGVELMSISRRLGHASLAITMRVYMHEIDELKQKDDKKIIKALNTL